MQFVQGVNNDVARHRPKGQPASRHGKAEEALYLREHVYRIETIEQYFDVQKRIRHARYALDSLLGGSRVYLGTSDELETLLAVARELRRRFDDLEPKAAPPQRVGGHVVRSDSPPLNEDDFKDLTVRQVELWQEAEEVLAKAYELMAGSVEAKIASPDQKAPELHILISLLQFHGAKRMDRNPPLRTYVFDFGLDAPFDVSFEDSEPRRRRAEAWYDQALELMARVVDAQRKQKDSAVLIRLTWVITILTVVVAILTGVTLVFALLGT